MRSFLSIAGLLVLCATASPSAAQSRDSTAATPTHPAPRDSFLGLDKPKHFLLSFFIQSASFATLQAAGAGRSTATGGASAVTVGFAVGKEVYDRKTKGLFSLGDLFWDVLGAGTASLMLRHTYK